MGLFVKFVPWNSNTLTSLINKTVKFSRVDEFNDFGEFRFISHETALHADSANHIKREIKEIDTQLRLLNIARAAGGNINEYGIDILKKKFSDIESIDFTNADVRILIETFIYNCVGIFSVSGIEIFSSTAKMLMFAHYAKNASGLALVYEVDDDKLAQVHYSDLSSKMTISKNHPENDWIKYNFDLTNMNAFTVKTEPWAYEHEYRMFSKPGITPAHGMGIELKAILYTGALENYNNSTKVLERINEHFYESAVKLKLLRPSLEEDTFIPSEESAYDFLDNL